MVTKTLDLHGIRHEEAKRKVVRFIEDNFNDENAEMEVITGHSQRMQEIVLNILEEYHLEPSLSSVLCPTSKIVFWFV